LSKTGQELACLALEKKVVKPTTARQQANDAPTLHQKSVTLLPHITIVYRPENARLTRCFRVINFYAVLAKQGIQAPNKAQVKLNNTQSLYKIDTKSG
jgi:hypothetical protein